MTWEALGIEGIARAQERTPRQVQGMSVYDTPSLGLNCLGSGSQKTGI